MRFIAWHGSSTAWKNSRDELPSRVPPHPLCGPPTFSVGRIEGGISVNTVPDECVIEIDRRMIPGEENVDAVAEVIELPAIAARF